MSFQAYLTNIQTKTGIRFRPRALYGDLGIIKGKEGLVVVKSTFCNLNLIIYNAVN